MGHDAVPALAAQPKRKASSVQKFENAMSSHQHADIPPQTAAEKRPPDANTVGHAYTAELSIKFIQVAPANPSAWIMAAVKT